MNRNTFPGLLSALREKQRLGDEQHRSENNPHQNHGVHPPVLNAEKSSPEIPAPDDINARDSDEQRGCTSLPGESPFDPLEKRYALVRSLQTANGGKQDGRHEAHATDPEDHTENVGGARNG